MLNESDVVIIGAGHAGGMAAIMLRKNKFKGSITLIGNEEYPPYQRPPLSKSFLDGKVGIERLFLKKIKFFNEKNINLLLKTKVNVINRRKKNLILENKQIITYKKLIIATGSKPVKLKTESKNSSLLYLRDINDAEKIKSLVSSSQSVGIIGSGYIGLEVAAIAAKNNLNVHIIEREERLMSRVVCPEVSNFYQKKHEAEGVIFILNNSKLDIENIGEYHILKIENNHKIKKDTVIVGIGIKPDILLAKNAGIECKNGITVDHNCSTSDKNIFAIGDCTSHPNKIFGDLRLESVHNAVEQAKTVASFIVKQPKPYHQVPWFWSEQYNIKLQIAGISDSYEEVVMKGVPENEKFTVFYFKNNILIALDAINSPKEFIMGKKLIEKKIRKSSQSFQDVIKIDN